MKKLMNNFEQKWEGFTSKQFEKLDNKFGPTVRKGATATKEFYGKITLKSKREEKPLKDNKVTQTAIYLLDKFGGPSNVETFTNCMTRLRVKIKNPSKVDRKAIESYENSMGLNVAGEEWQVILGPGFVKQVADVFAKISEADQSEEVAEVIDLDMSTTTDITKITEMNKESKKLKNTSPIQQFLAKFSKIFTPMIFGFIGAGILGGIAGIIQSGASESMPDGVGRIWKSLTAESWHLWLNFMIEGWKGAFIIIVGWRTADVFGGSGVIGAISSMVFVSQFGGLATGIFRPMMGETGFFDADGVAIMQMTHVNFIGINIQAANLNGNWLTVGFDASSTLTEGVEAFDGNGVSIGTIDIYTGASFAYARGAVFGAMIIAGLSVPIEKNIRKHIPGALDMTISGMFTLFILLFLNYFMVVPVSGYMFEAVAWLFTTLSSNGAGAAFLAAIFLLTVVFGVHQGFVPVYAAVIAETGVNSLFPILAMGGAGQVGVGLALMLKTESGSMLRNQVKGAIIPAFMGIGEPMIYGITLPRPKTFASAMFGGFLGGLFLGLVNQFGGDMIGLNSQFGPSGILALPMITSQAGNLGYAMPMYVLSLLIAYGGGFIGTYLIGTKGVDLS